MLPVKLVDWTNLESCLLACAASQSPRLWDKGWQNYPPLNEKERKKHQEKPTLSKAATLPTFHPQAWRVGLEGHLPQTHRACITCLMTSNNRSASGHRSLLILVTARAKTSNSSDKSLAARFRRIVLSVLFTAKEGWAKSTIIAWPTNCSIYLGFPDLWVCCGLGVASMSRFRPHKALKLHEAT